MLESQTKLLLVITHLLEINNAGFSKKNTNFSNMWLYVVVNEQSVHNFPLVHIKAETPFYAILHLQREHTG